jgi:hypothetical protein
MLSDTCSAIGIWTTNMFQLRISFLVWECYRRLIGHSKWRISPSQGLFIHTTTQTQKKRKTSIYGTSGIRTKYPRVRAVESGTPLKPHVHSDWPH